MWGNFVLEGFVVKIIGKEGLYFFGFVCVFEGEEVMLDVIIEDF